MKVSGVRLHCLVLPLALFIFVAEVQAVGICDWDMRTYTTQKGPVHLRTVRSGGYKRGYIGEMPFSAKWFSRTTCYLGDVKFRCVYADDGEILGTNMTVPNITNVDTIFIDSTYPVTVHRIETHVQDKSFTGRFIVDKDMRLTKCPKYKRTTLVWKFPGTVQTRQAFECYRGDVRLCKGTTIKNETGKCVVTVAGDNLIHTLAVKAPRGDVEFFYCRLSPATPYRALTYNVDWRYAQPIPLEATTTETAADVEPTPQMEDKKNNPKEQNATPPGPQPVPPEATAAAADAQPIPPEGKPTESAAVSDVKPIPPNGKKNNPKEPGAIPPVAPPKQGNRPYDRQQLEIMIAHTTSDARRLTGAIVLLVVTLGGNL